MDPRINPYAPGAGTPPPELAGRDALIEEAAVALDRIRARRSSRSIILYGLRGVGKTVLLNRFRLDAEARGLESIQIEAPEGRSLPAMLGPAIRALLLRLSHVEAGKALIGRALAGLAGFVGAMKLKYGDVEVGIDVEPVRGLADSGDLDSDLTALLRAIGEAARAADTAIVLYVDELQYVVEEQLASLITALHASSQMQLPVTMMAAGLPQLLGQTGRAKSYAERLFSFVRVDRLDEAAAISALCVPAGREGVSYEPEAIDEVLGQTLGYPYFLQEWGKHCWNVAAATPITREDARRATINALAELDASFFRVRFDRLTPAEKSYARAMAELGPGPHRSGDIAEALGRRVTSAAPIRNNLITKGMVYAPSHGDTAFTVPLFDGFLRRIMSFEPPVADS
jgi:hypothetical protein